MHQWYWQYIAGRFDWQLKSHPYTIDMLSRQQQKFVTDFPGHNAVGPFNVIVVSTGLAMVTGTVRVVSEQLAPPVSTAK
jgi:hypothetical protein